MKAAVPFTLLLFLLVVGQLQAQITEVTITVEGMACPFCGYGIEKRLLKVDSIDTVTIDLKAGTALSTAKSGRSIDIGDVQRAIRKAGFSPAKIELLASGQVVTSAQESSDELLLDLVGSGRLALAAKEDQRGRLRALLERRSTVELRGAIQWSEETPVLSVERIEEVSS